jgi:uncharacterized protein involved in exopolysaccharide biosynthesis
METPQIPLLPSPTTSGGPPAQTYSPSSQFEAEPREDEGQLPLGHYVWILRRHAWKIITLVEVCVFSTIIVSKRLEPIFEATATVNIDRQAPSAVVGSESDRVMAVNDSDQFLATQIKLIQSDAVLRPVAEKFNLLKVENQMGKLDTAGSQKKALAPISLSRLTVTRPPNTYLLLISYRSPNPQLAADVANAIATSYVSHSYNLRIRSSASLSAFMEKQLDELRAKMERSGQALSEFEKELNVINPEEKTNILSSRLLQLNTEYTNAQADRIRKEAMFNSMKAGTLEAAQVSTQGEALARLNERLNDARQHFAQVKATFGDGHPEYRKAAYELEELQKQLDATRANIAQRIEVDYRQAVNREQMLQADVVATKAESDSLNSRSFEYNRLKQDAEADKKLYDQLIRKIQEAGINSGFQNNNVTIADSARPTVNPVFPKTSINVLLAAIASLILGLVAAITSDAMDTTLRDAENASRYLGTDVIGMLPSVKKLSELTKSPTGAVVATEPTPKQIEAANDYRKKGYYRTISGFEESIRTLRNTILLGDLDTQIRSLMITSAGPGEGKSTVSAHLAIALSRTRAKARRRCYSMAIYADLALLALLV